MVAEEGPSGVWVRIKGLLKIGGEGQGADYERVPMQVLRDEKQETPSSRFVYYSIPVSTALLLECVYSAWCSLQSARADRVLFRCLVQ